MDALKKLEGYRKWYDKIWHTVMDINGKHHDGFLNLIMLEGYTKPKGAIVARGVHANHKKYNKVLIGFFDERWEKDLKYSMFILNNNPLLGCYLIIYLLSDTESILLVFTRF